MTLPPLNLEAVNTADIRGEKTRIRSMRPDELALLYEWEADPDVEPFYGSRGRYKDFEEYVAQIEPHYLDGSKPEHGRCFIIEAIPDPSAHPEPVEGPIGMINTNRIHTHARSTEIDVVIGRPGYRERGYGSDAITAFLAFLFDTVGLHRVWLETYDYNARARRVYEKLGFVQEGVARESSWKDGRWVANVIYGILEDEFRRLHT